jgi:hypothetical protein
MHLSICCQKNVEQLRKRSVSTKGSLILKVSNDLCPKNRFATFMNALGSTRP